DARTLTVRIGASGVVGGETVDVLQALVVAQFGHPADEGDVRVPVVAVQDGEGDPRVPAQVLQAHPARVEVDQGPSVVLPQVPGGGGDGGTVGAEGGHDAGVGPAQQVDGLLGERRLGHECL